MLTVALYLSVYLLVGLVFALGIERVVNSRPSGAERYPSLASDAGFCITITTWPVVVYLFFRFIFRNIAKGKSRKS